MDGWRDEDDVAALALARRLKRVRLRRWVVAALGLGAVSFVAFFLFPLGKLLRGEMDIEGRRAYRPSHTPDREALRRVDLERVHRQLFPDWVVAAARQRRHADADEDRTFAELRAEVSPDPNLVEILDQLRALTRGEGLRRDPERALYLSWAWTSYLDAMDAPYVVQGSVLSTRRGPVYSAIVYNAVADARVRVGADEYRVRVGSRIDGLNVREAYLGAAGRDDALIVVDRLQEFALTDVWPLLDADLDESYPQLAPFGPAVRREARDRLSAADYLTLERTARARHRIVATIEEIHGRQRCGSTFVVHAVPWFGFEKQRINRLRGFALASADRDCPSITPDEIAILADASAALSGETGTQTAVEALVAWTAEHVAIHEARHLADRERADGFDRPLPCSSCTDEMGIVARAELSGYLASIGWSPSPATALYQACLAIAQDKRLSRGAVVTGPHADALSLIQRRLGPVCEDGPPPALAKLGRELEVEMLGRSEPMALAGGFPERVAVDDDP